MTNAVLAFVFLCALSISIINQPLLVAADASTNQVLDTSGSLLGAAAPLNYILPANPIFKCEPHGPQYWSHYAGLSLTGIGKYCPLDVVVVDKYHALHCTFTPVNPKKSVVCVSTDLNIHFSSNNNKCPQSTVWKLDRFDCSPKQWFVTSGGTVGNPGWETIKNWFQIKEYDGDHKLVYCPSVMCKS